MDGIISAVSLTVLPTSTTTDADKKSFFQGIVPETATFFIDSIPLAENITSKPAVAAPFSNTTTSESAAAPVIFGMIAPLAAPPVRVVPFIVILVFMCLVLLFVLGLGHVCC